MRSVSKVPLASLTTLRLGGPAERLLEIEREDELVEALREADQRGVPVLVLGGGSNLVVGDAGFAGTVLKMAIPGVRVEAVGERVRVEVGAGEDWDGLVARAVDEGLAGIECMAGIPGLAGGTPIQNVGAYGQELSDTAVSVRVYDRAEGRFFDLPAAACGFAYRASRFKHDPRYVVTRVTLELWRQADSRPLRYAELCRALGVKDGGQAPLAEVRSTVVRLRRGKGMVLDSADPDTVSAGSFFTNPILTAEELMSLRAHLGPDKQPPVFAYGPHYKVAAAWLCEQAGFVKGTRRGRVGVSSKHALALVNAGGTTAELVALAEEIVTTVRARFGVTLVPEPVFVGTTLSC